MEINSNSNNNSNNYDTFNETIFNDISTTIYQVLNKYKDNNNNNNENNEQDDGIILSNKKTLKDLIENDSLNEDDVFFVNEPSCKEIFNYENASTFFEQLKNGEFYYPPKPFYKHISLVFMVWSAKCKFPIQFNPLYGLNEVVKSEQEKDNISIFKKDDDEIVITDNNKKIEEKEKEKEELNSNENFQNIELIHFENLNEKVVSFLKNEWKLGSDNKDDVEKKEKFFYEFFKNLSNRNLLTLFGIRKTKLSLDNILLPGPIQLIKSSNLLHSPPPASSKLTVSSRALSKHGIRSNDSFWGSDKGPELIKNKRSEGVIIKILKEPAWINIHLLPHDIKILEIRNQKGYGLRWSADGTFFRGFLEPQMEGGHEVGWRH